MKHAIKIKHDTGVGTFTDWYTWEGAIMVFPTFNAASMYIKRKKLWNAHTVPVSITES